MSYSLRDLNHVSEFPKSPQRKVAELRLFSSPSWSVRPPASSNSRTAGRIFEQYDATMCLYIPILVEVGQQ
jgi:hypothetical protein